MSATRASVVKNIRVNDSTLDLIERAAALTGDNFTHYVLSAARSRAELELMDRNLFIVSDAEFDRVEAEISSPRKAPEALRKLRAEGKARRSVADGSRT